MTLYVRQFQPSHLLAKNWIKREETQQNGIWIYILVELPIAFLLMLHVELFKKNFIHKARIAKEGGGITFFARDYWYNRWDTGWWFFGLNALFESFTCLSHVTKTHPCATKGTCLVLSGKCAKSALKQSDSVANSNVQGTGRHKGSSRETPVQTLQNTVFTRH